MKRHGLGLQIPGGTADILPREQAFARQLEREIIDRFTAWAYQEVATPTFEYLACINPHWEKDEKLYKFFDSEGNILALRPELTTPIARMVATRLNEQELPLRLCYAGEIFRYQKPPTRRAFRQAGVELVGSDSPLADAEVIALSVATLRDAGVKEFQINLGHIGIFRGLLGDLGLEADKCRRIENRIARKDFVALELFLAESGLEAREIELILGLSSFHGGEEVLDKVAQITSGEITSQALENLREVYRALKMFGVSEVAIDLGVLRGFDYYTGVVFEGYAPGLGFPLCEGGRYDGLLENFGFHCPATGFAVNLERLANILQAPECPQADLLVAGTNMANVIAKAGELRSQGLKVEMVLVPMDKNCALEYGTTRGIKEILYV
jgi:ATP phosphoribosyltransferase regulatory subunit